MSTADPPRGLTRQEAAARLGISLGLLDRHRRNNEIGFEKNPVTRAIRFPLDEVDKLAALRAQTTQHQP